MKIIECEQGSPEWYKARAGIPSASCFDMIVTQKGERSKQAEKYMYRLACECVSGRVEESFTSAAMERGKVLEAEARDMYQLIHDVEVEQVGFCLADNGLYGASPDGIVKGKKKGIEIKCPISSTIVKYMIDKDALVSEYFQQVQGGMHVTWFETWDLIGYYPGLKPVIITIERDDKFQKALSVELGKFCAELKEVIAKIR